MIRVKYLCKWISYFLTFILAFGLSSVSLAQGTTYQIQALAWNPTGTTLAAAGNSSNGGGIWLYNTTGQIVDQINVSSNVLSISWSPDGSKLAGRTAGVPDTYFVWDATTKDPLVSFEEPFPSDDYNVYWSPTGNRFATVASTAVLIRNSSTGALFSTILSPGSNTDAVQGVAWSIDGTKLYVASSDKVIRIWNVTTSTPTISNTFSISRPLNTMALSPDGTRIAVGVGDRDVQILDAQTGVLQTTFQGSDTTQAVAFLKWRPVGNQIAAASFKNIKIWDLTTSSMLATFSHGNYSRPQAMDYNLNGKFAYISNSGPLSIVDTPQSSIGLFGQYYDNIDLTNLKLNRLDSIVDFNWGTGSPNALIRVDTFSVRWTGQVVPQYTQTYTFYTQSDDGVRLWVNNQQIINNWTDHQSVENTGTIALTAGVRYNIRMEYYENNNNTVARLSWSSSSQPKQVIPTNRLLPNGRIAFQSFRDGNDEIYLMNGDGTNQVNFTSNSAADQFPTAAVGTQNLVFASTRTGNAEIFTAPLAGGAAVNLTNHGSYDHYASQAQDGRIAFASTRSAGGNFDLWTINADGSGLTQLTSTTGAERNSGWSPDGQWIVYDLDVSGVYDLWKIPSAGGTAVRLTQNVGSNSDPSWSPDGTTIVFKTTRDGGHSIYLMNADGSNQRPFKSGGLNGFNPTWSPDGTYITYQAFPTSQPDIYSIPLGGTTSTQLTNNAAADQAASWGAQ